MMKRNQKGITLIALVITIVVLLILAGVSITAVFGDNGILNLAKEAAKKTNEAKDNDLRQMSMAEAVINFKNTKYEDKTGKIVTIPAGFAVSQVDGENIVDDGLVIIDSKGNEFVWVPVMDINNFKPIVDYDGSGKLRTDINDYLEYNDRYEDEVQEYKSMFESVKNNKGFFIGRFETGIEDDEIVVKKNTAVYHSVVWGRPMTDQDGAVDFARSFCINNNYSSVVSTLCYGVQFDAILQFFDNKYLTGECDESSCVYNGRAYGNCTGKLALTGSDEKYKIKNIYDIIGNVNEWTMQTLNNDKYNKSVRMNRGWDYAISEGATISPSSRWTNYPTTTSDKVGFRVALYLK